MSLGSSTGSMVDAGSDIVDAIKRARAKGSFCSYLSRK